MEDLHLNTIPSELLARILLQLHTLPPTKQFSDSVNILSAGLNKYGHTGDLHAFLEYCASLTLSPQETWAWNYYEINHDLDWDSAKLRKPQEIIGLRFLIASETARKQVQLTQLGQKKILNPNCYYLYGDRVLPVDQVLRDALAFLKSEDSADEIVEKLIDLRLEQYAKDISQAQQESSELDTTDYQLMGALLVRYDSSASEGNAPNAWCLYLRDYMNSEDGNMWRVILKDNESTITSDQALADIRGAPTDSMQPSELSKDYRPVYLFYVNQNMVIPPEEEMVGVQQHITLDDYTFDDDDEYEYVAEVQPPEESEVCAHCGIADIVEDVNDIFFCEMCDKAVHQFCENPPIQSFEKKVDPWYCRACCIKQNIPFPSPPQLDAQTLLQHLSTQQQQPDLPIKRKRTEGEEAEAEKSKK